MTCSASLRMGFELEATSPRVFLWPARWSGMDEVYPKWAGWALHSGPMIDIKLLRENPARFALGAKAKNIHVDIDRILKLDERRRTPGRGRQTGAPSRGGSPRNPGRRSAN